MNMHAQAAENPRERAAMRYELTLPFPPSVNDIWKFIPRHMVGKRGKRVRRDEDYEAWIKAADGCVLEQLGIPPYRPTIRGRYVLTIALDLARFGQVDQDNCVKAVSDALQRNRSVENDKFAWETMVCWKEFANSHTDAPLCAVSVTEFR